ncbi:aminodeoxychorismate synthase component I [Streptococcus parasanguinis]|uniref:aminodeoxychorismate synthase component I n=1 Tax=Streptococcus parasanguinis TaxID=1318 RepID=UPI001896D663|nr:aminodeoxychorismate synthase component I [Streptococcus parasanguinis]MCY7049914.1 aminodeoxychorismate synthase component I [Streptococcus parasanguinis]MDB8624969.1 aminodeoxychorismate synthase component I [Streptococcus parasanguinis]
MHKQTIIDFKELGLRYLFTKPIKELKTKNLDQVEALLREVEAYQEKGFYAVGYVSYEAAPAFEKKFAVHPAPLLGEYLLYFTIHEEVETLPFPEDYEDVDLPANWKEEVEAPAYQEAIETIHHHIRQGDTYQVNYTVQLSQELKSDPLAIYNRLVVEQKAHYNAFIQHDDVSILSISPELFFEQDDRLLTTRPMKGTTRRGLTNQADLQEAAWLKADPKNRAENMMIVDLLRNDMNRISEIGSEQVTRLCQVEQYSTVWQMTSTIESRLRSEIDLVQTFRALFPCGSITGAPKISTMEIIQKTEKAPRGVYCGTIGILLPRGKRIFNVAIRTLQMQGGQAIYGVGGGITWDSKWESEYQETKQKSAVLYRQEPRFELLTTGRIHQGELTFLEQHLTRLREASRYFAYPYDEQKLLKELQEELAHLESNLDYRCRIALQKNGTFHLEITELTDLPASYLQAQLTEQKLDLATPFTYFKTSQRDHLSQSEREQIFHLPDGTLLETTIGNLVLEIGGQLYTPPAHLPLLDGIYRRHLLETQQVEEKLLTLKDLTDADRIYACNALRGLYELDFQRKDS